MKNTVAVISFYCAVNLIAYGEALRKRLSIQIISLHLALAFDLCGETHVVFKHYASGYFCV